ncbi:epoxide hydrolase A-like [Helianthus annuus]|uniref:epoxide hydrolase A-like n=1 Tax=Helianthus annuus TaxID=4232 RepID=UPI00165339DF|nr:epoxide hydrolase A-like [Helianthus annuus]
MASYPVVNFTSVYVKKELETLEKSFAFGANLDMDLLGIEIDDNTLIPGLAVASSREPGVMEAEIESYGTEHVLKRILIESRPGPLRFPKSEPFGPKSSPCPLPQWLTQEDLNYNLQKFQQKGFTGPLNYYRALDLNWELTAPWTAVKIRVPVIFVVGDKDPLYTTPGTKAYVQGGMFKNDVPLLQQIVVLEGALKLKCFFFGTEIVIWQQHIFHFVAK